MTRKPDTPLAPLLLEWYDREGRDLPWRRAKPAAAHREAPGHDAVSNESRHHEAPSHDRRPDSAFPTPYAVLVSEIMLQQTQVNRVIGYFQRWLARFPDWQALADAPTAEVLEYWSGLGYNRRALMLKGIAEQVANTGLPRTEEGWRQLKGIGPYTAAAIMAIGLQQRAIPIDTNIRRVGGRVFQATPFPEQQNDKDLTPALEALFDQTTRYGDLVQSLFDLSSLICQKIPICTTDQAACPISRHCRSFSLFQSGSVEIPRQSVKKSNERKHRNKPHPDRIYRGRILKLVTAAKTGFPIQGLGARIDPDFHEDSDADWLEAMITRLEADGLITRTKTRLFLP